MRARPLPDLVVRVGALSGLWALVCGIFGLALLPNAEAETLFGLAVLGVPGALWWTWRVARRRRS